MPAFSASDSAYMAHALQLAGRGRYTARPNPMVGCVLVRDGEIVGEGWHRQAGAAHAEINALNDAGEKARGATAYVTLEPCSHHGKTPPCAAALIDAGVAAVVVGLTDPHPAVDGEGIAALTAASIPVQIGLLEGRVKELLRGFLSRVQRGRPFVTLKIAASLDGGIAMASGESQWITGEAARADVQRLRARSGAVMTGIGTVLADDPSLTVRDPGIDTDGLQPLRIVVDSRLRTPPSARMLSLPGATLVYCCAGADATALTAAGAEVVAVDGDSTSVGLAAVLRDLAKREINDLLVEAGPALAGSLLAQNLVDELVIYQAPHIMGSETQPMFRTPAWTALADRRELDITDVRRVGNDTRITALLAG